MLHPINRNQSPSTLKVERSPTMKRPPLTNWWTYTPIVEFWWCHISLFISASRNITFPSPVPQQFQLFEYNVTLSISHSGPLVKCHFCYSLPKMLQFPKTLTFKTCLKHIRSLVTSLILEGALHFLICIIWGVRNKLKHNLATNKRFKPFQHRTSE